MTDAPTKPGVCTLRECPEHRDDPDWQQVWQPRQAPVTAHLRAVS